MKFKEPLIVDILRVKNNGPRPPLRSQKEMANEFGVTMAALKAFVQHNGGPSPVLKTGSGHTIHKNVWYEPISMRKWWARMKNHEAAHKVD